MMVRLYFSKTNVNVEARLDDEFARDGFLVSMAFVAALAEMSSYLPSLRVSCVLFNYRPPYISYICEGDLCEEFMHTLHKYLEELGNITIEVRGNKYTFHIHKKLRL